MHEIVPASVMDVPWDLANVAIARENLSAIYLYKNRLVYPKL